MANQPVSMARRHVLGDISHRCEPIDNVPVYLDDALGEILGYADESLGKYADAITFHVEDAVAKKLATGHFTYSFELDYAEDVSAQTTTAQRRIKLNSIQLIQRKAYVKPPAKAKAGETVPEQTEA